MSIFSRMLRKKTSKKPAPQLTSDPGKDKVFSDKDLNNRKISSKLKENLEFIKSVFGMNLDFIVREFRLGVTNREAFLVYLDSLTSEARISDNVLKPLILESRIAGIDKDGINIIELVEKSILTSAIVRKRVSNMMDVFGEILYGSAALFIDGADEAVITEIKEWPQRNVEKADVEGVVRGPKESFTENISVNTSLVRRRMRSPKLVIEGMTLGRMTNTTVAVGYLRGVVSPGLCREVKKRVSRIDIDAVLESGYIEELIQDDPYSPFPQIVYTEKPDRVVAALLEGRVCIFTDGTPMVLFVPGLFNDLLQNPEDYYERYHFATAIRLLRYLGLAVSLLLPSFYIAVITFHQEMIPTQLLISIVATREGVPFPALVEALIMELTFEALREAGLRLPRAVGQAVSIVGALVIGQSAVMAGIVSPLMVIIVAITGIASFMIPSYNLALSMRLIRFPIMFLAATLGLFGVMTGVLFILIHLTGIRSFGVPYLSPLAPMKLSDLKDYMVRAPWWAMQKRSTETVKVNKRRMAPDLKPQPPAGRGGPSSRSRVGGRDEDPAILPGGLGDPMAAAEGHDRVSGSSGLKGGGGGGKGV